MTKQLEKLVLSFDKESLGYKPAGHNLLPEQAVELADKLESQGKGSLIIDQDSRHHNARNFSDCKVCKKAAEEATSKYSPVPQQDEGEQALAASPEEQIEGE